MQALYQSSCALWVWTDLDVNCMQGGNSIPVGSVLSHPLMPMFSFVLQRAVGVLSMVLPQSSEAVQHVIQGNVVQILSQLLKVHNYTQPFFCETCYEDKIIASYSWQYISQQSRNGFILQMLTWLNWLSLFYCDFVSIYPERRADY